MTKLDLSGIIISDQAIWILVHLYLLRRKILETKDFPGNPLDLKAKGVFPSPETSKNVYGTALLHIIAQVSMALGRGSENLQFCQNRRFFISFLRAIKNIKTYWYSITLLFYSGKTSPRAFTEAFRRVQIVFDTNIKARPLKTRYGRFCAVKLFDRKSEAITHNN